MTTSTAPQYPAPPPAVIKDGNKSSLELFSLRGKVASITGGSIGIGWAVAEAFAQAGADVAIWYQSHNPQEKADILGKRYGVKVKAYKASITDYEAVKSTVDKQVSDFGRIDICVANAGVAWQGNAMIDEPDNNEWDRVIRTDLDSAYYCAKAIGPLFKTQNHGSFIFTASISGQIVNVPRWQAAYNAAKSGVVHLSKSLAVEWASFARVNSVSPGYILTDILNFAPEELRNVWWSLTPLGRPADPQELVGAYVYLASDASTYTTGCDLKVDGGYTLM